MEAAQAAIAACKAQGYNVTVTVADRGGMPMAVPSERALPIPDQGSYPRRAYTAALLENIDRGIHEKVSNAHRL